MRMNKKLLFLVLVIGFLIGFGATYFLYYPDKKAKGDTTSATAESQSDINNEKPVTDVKTLGILTLGYGGAGHDGGYLTDAIQLAYINFEKSSITLISIPRDLWVKLPNNSENKINAAIINLGDSSKKDQLVQTGAAKMKGVVSQITGLPVDYFVGVDFVGYQRLVGIALDGIEVEVHETLEDAFYPIKGEELNLCGKDPAEVATLSAKLTGFELEKQFTCRYKHLLFKPGKQTFEGEQALEYVRSRHGSAAGDVSRGKRQQEVLLGMKNKLFSLSALKNVPTFYDTISKHTVSDINLDIIKYLSPLLSKANDFKVTTINLGPENVLINSKSSAGAYIMIPKEGVNNWSGVQKYIKSEIEK